MKYEVNRIVNKEFIMQYMKFGEGDKTLVILPGLSVQRVLPAAAVIEQQYVAFEKEFTVYLFERREDLPPIYSVFDMANDTAKAMQELGLSDVCLFGASQGGMMAMMIAAIHPELVKKLALGSTTCRIKGNRSWVIYDWITLARKGEKEKLYLAFGEKLYPKKVFTENEEMLRQMAKTVSKSDLERFIILAEGIKGFDITDMLKDIKCPVLAVGDKNDEVLGAVATREIADVLKNHPHFESHMYRGYGHAVYDTAPDFKERLYRFFVK